MTMWWMLCCLLGVLAGPVLKPFPTQLDRWQREGEAEGYTGRELFKAIDGGAEVYLSYGFERLVVASFVHDGSRVDAFFYHMSSPLAAWGIFRRERPELAIEVEGAAEAAFREPNLCTMVKRKVYVKIVAIRGELDAVECKRLLASAASGLAGSTDLPRQLGLLPGAGLVAGSEGYEPGGLLGLSELSRALHAAYRMNGKQYEIFALLEREGKLPSERFHVLPPCWREARGAPWPARWRKLPYRGPVLLARTPKAVLGVAGAGSIDEAIKVLTSVLAVRSGK